MQLIQNEPSWNWTALVSLSRRKHERRQVREASCEVFCSCNSEFAIFPLGAAVWHANCDRHKLPMTAKFCADCDLTLAMDRCSHLAEFQMGYLHEVPPGQVEDTSPENSLRAIKFIFFSSWAAFPFVGVPDHGRRVTPSGIIRTQQHEIGFGCTGGMGTAGDRGFRRFNSRRCCQCHGGNYRSKEQTKDGIRF